MSAVLLCQWEEMKNSQKNAMCIFSSYGRKYIMEICLSDAK